MRVELSPIRSLTPSELTRELLSLCGEAGAIERRMLLISFCGSDRGVHDPAQALATLADLMGAMPDEERRLQLYFARRLVAYGQRQYGRLDLASDHRSFSVEALEEDTDATVYRMAAELQGRSDGLLDRSLETMRKATSALLRRELL